MVAPLIPEQIREQRLCLKTVGRGMGLPSVDISSYYQAENIGRKLLADVAQEHVLAFAITTDNKIRSWTRLHIGGSSSSYIDAKNLIQYLLLTGAPGCLLMHNHPSGNPHPSEDDLRATSVLWRKMRLLDLTLLDHIIIASGGTFSFHNSGIIARYQEQHAPIG